MFSGSKDGYSLIELDFYEDSDKNIKEIAIVKLDKNLKVVGWFNKKIENGEFSIFRYISDFLSNFHIVSRNACYVALPSLNASFYRVFKPDIQPSSVIDIDEYIYGGYEDKDILSRIKKLQEDFKNNIDRVIGKTEE